MARRRKAKKMGKKRKLRLVTSETYVVGLALSSIPTLTLIDFKLRKCLICIMINEMIVDNRKYFVQP